MGADRVYEVFLENRARRDLRRLEAKAFQRLIQAIQALGGNPRPRGCRKIVGSGCDWRIRIGDYRVIYEIDDATSAVRVMYVRHRRDAYR